MVKVQNIILGIFGILIIIIIAVLYSLYSSNLVDINDRINRNDSDRLNDLADISKTYMRRSGGTFTGSIAVEGQITSYDIRVINTKNDNIIYTTNGSLVVKGGGIRVENGINVEKEGINVENGNVTLLNGDFLKPQPLPRTS